MKRSTVIACIAALLVSIFAFRREIIQAAHRGRLMLTGESTIASRVAEYGESARERMQPFFAQARIAYPPRKALLLGLKHERRIELYALSEAEQFQFIRDY